MALFYKEDAAGEGEPEAQLADRRCLLGFNTDRIAADIESDLPAAADIGMADDRCIDDRSVSLGLIVGGEPHLLGPIGKGDLVAHRRAAFGLDGDALPIGEADQRPSCLLYTS